MKTDNLEGTDHHSLRGSEVRGKCQTREDEIHPRCFSESVIDNRTSDRGRWLAGRSGLRGSGGACTHFPPAHCWIAEPPLLTLTRCGEKLKWRGPIQPSAPGAEVSYTQGGGAEVGTMAFSKVFFHLSHKGNVMKMSTDCADCWVGCLLDREGNAGRCCLFDLQCMLRKWWTFFSSF